MAGVVFPPRLMPEEALAHHIARTRFEDLPPDAVAATKEHILHTLGTVLAGSAAPGCPELVGLLEESGGRPESSVLGWGLRMPAHAAAFANSAMAHAQEFDNNDDRIAYKSSVCAVPAALAIAERQSGVTGRDFLAAACVGIDFGIRLGLAIEPQPAHPIAPNLGPFAAAAASSRLLGLTKDQVWDALALASCGVAVVGSSTSALSYTKRFQTGAAARNGVFAALLAARGYRARQEVFGGRSGYYQVVHGRDGNVDVLMDGLGERYEVVNVGPKAYPSCRYTHGAIDAALALTRENDLHPEDIAKVTVTVGPRDFMVVFGGEQNLAAKQRPESVVDAQFSIPYTVASAIARRRVVLDDMTEAAIRDSAVVGLAERVMPRVDPDLDNWPADVKPCEVEVVLRTGRRHARRVDYPKGNPRNPVPHEEIRANFLAFAARSARPLPPRHAERALEALEALEEVRDMAELTGLLGPAAH